MTLKPISRSHYNRTRCEPGTARGPALFGALPFKVALGLVLVTGVSPAQWSPVAPGLDCRDYNLAGPVRVFAVRADRSVESWTIDTMTSLGEIKGGRETVPEMAARYNDSITADGHRYAVKAAINGDYFDMKSGVALGGQILSGWFAKRFGEFTGPSGFVWTTDRRCFLGGNVQNSSALQHVTFADGSQTKINFLNEPRGEDGLALYTPQFAASTGTDSDGIEAVVRMDAPVGLPPPTPGVEGEIVKIRDHAGSSLLPFNHVVLSAHGKAAAELRNRAKVGQPVHFKLDLKDSGYPAIGLATGDWHNAFASIGATKYILVNGQVPRDWEIKAAEYAAEGKKHGSVIKDPRTVIAFNDRYVYFLVIDGRSKASVGMTFTEAGLFCKDELKAMNAAMQDGGGSSTLWVDGQVRNTPSGKGAEEKAGSLRAVANGYLIAEVLPPMKSAAFKDGQKVRFKSGGELRLGPGLTFGSAGKVADTDTGLILKEPLNGIFAKGAYWWLCRFGETDGWASLEQLTTLP